VHISRLDLNLLVVFEAIYAEGGVTRAGQRLNLTQPAISHALQRLREAFGDPLFHRQGQAMTPTPVARAMIDPVRRALRTIGTVVDERGEFDPQGSGRRFTIGLRDVMESEVLPRLMRHLSIAAPGIDIVSTRVNRTDLERDLAAGVLDAAVDVLMPMSQDVRHALIAGDKLVVVARQGHPDVRRGLTLETYLKQEHVLVTSRRTGFGLADLEVARYGHRRRIRLRCQQNFAACRVVSETDLILTMPERYAQIANLPFKNQIIAAPFDGPSQDVYLYWHTNVDKDPGNQWIRDQLFAAFDTRSSPRDARRNPASPKPFRSVNCARGGRKSDLKLHE
jgi:DNA-binding transcriptional LysR family regulator